ncbi:amino acid aminotransferase [Sphingomonas sp. ASV193]|uniref:amino acid aminotransferase n=1 Tax=Sphingomonas sp. ASV193 TaxID=3144405 RepID=UPI0032E8A670
MLTDAHDTLFDSLPAIQPDALLALIAMHRADPREDKIDVGVGVFRDGAGNTPIPGAVKEGERRLLESQQTKAYLGMRGDARFTDLIRPILLGPHAADDRIVGLQTPGGCGALALGFQLLRVARPGATVHVGAPTWPNHPPIIAAAGLKQQDYVHYEKAQGALRFDAMMAALEGAAAGDVVLLHGCCHNPTGADLSADEWARVAEALGRRGLIPFIDIAYQGLGRGLEEDAAGLRMVLDACDEAIVAQSCDKNFGVYRDRVGNLFVKGRSAASAALAMDHAMQMARTLWSMPPDHGAAACRIVLDDPALKAQWEGELAAIRDRLNQVRATIAAADPRLAFIGRQYGMFSMLPLSAAQVRGLREEHAIYMADSGRFNVVGMSDAALPRFIDAVVGALDG